MASVEPVEYNEQLVREVIRRNKTDLAETMDFGSIVDHLFAECVISTSQHDELVTYRNNKGQIYASGQLLEMILKKDVQVAGFMSILREHLPWMETELAKGVKRFESGEWTLPGQIDITGKTPQSHISN